MTSLRGAPGSRNGRRGSTWTSAVRHLVEQIGKMGLKARRDERLAQGALPLRCRLRNADSPSAPLPACKNAPALTSRRKTLHITLYIHQSYQKFDTESAAMGAPCLAFRCAPLKCAARGKGTAPDTRRGDRSSAG